MLPFIAFSWLWSRKITSRLRFLLNKCSSICRIWFVESDNCSRKLKSLNTLTCRDKISLKLNVRNFNVLNPLNAFSASSRILFSRRFSVFSTFAPWKTKSSKSVSSVWVIWMFTRLSAMIKSPLSRFFNGVEWITRFWVWGNFAKKSFVKNPIVRMFSIRRLSTSTFDFPLSCRPSIKLILALWLSFFNSFTTQPYFRQTKSFSKAHLSVIEVHEVIVSRMHVVAIERLQIEMFHNDKRRIKWATKIELTS